MDALRSVVLINATPFDAAGAVDTHDSPASSTMP